MTGYQSKKAAAQAIDEVNWADHEPDGLAQPEQEPVAFCDTSDPDARTAFSWPGLDRQTRHTTVLLTSPPQRKPLTDEQYFEIGQRHWLTSSKVEQIHKELEAAAHGIKENTND